MSMFDLVFGSNPNVKQFVDTVIGNTGRYRSAWIEKGQDGLPILAVYTRNGGGNREHWDKDKEPGDQCDCTGCIATYRLPKHRLYISDSDDEFDSTYATFYFHLPEELLRQLDTANPGWRERVQAHVNMSERWLEVIESLKKP